MMAAKDINLQELQKPADEASSKEKKKAPATIAMNLLAEVSTLAWNLVIPIVGGVLLGHYIDKRSKAALLDDEPACVGCNDCFQQSLQPLY